MSWHVVDRWRGPGGYGELLVLAGPLMLTTGAWTVQYFIDAMFLAWYSPEAVAAVLPAGVFVSTVMSVFIGTAGYSHTFVAQYAGSGRTSEIAPIVWQGLYLAVLGGLVCSAASFAAGPLFRLTGHEPRIAALEQTYVHITCLGAAPAILAASLAGFFSGTGRTWPVMWVNLLASATNLGLDYLLIFGRFGFRELGVTGAALATLASNVVAVLAYLLLMARRGTGQPFAVFHGWQYRKKLFGRLVRFGFPNGVHFLIDVGGFTVFVMLIGRLGETAAAASNIAFNVNTLAFLPMVGMGIAVSILVARYLGQERPEIAARSVYSGFHLTVIYMGGIALLYLLVPDLFIAPFGLRADPATFEPIHRQTVTLLRFVAFYSLFDTMNVIFVGAIKGAGDTRFVMRAVATVAVGGLVLPCIIALVPLGRGLLCAWTILTGYVIALGLVFLGRFLGGAWRTMRVIEEHGGVLPPSVPRNEATQFELT